MLPARAAINHRKSKVETGHDGWENGNGRETKSLLCRHQLVAKQIFFSEKKAANCN
jgi:hypothetical protein